jgi:polyphosphate kinase
MTKHVIASEARQNDLGPASLFFNRELSWLEFNDRVLQEGQCASLPLAERLKFLAIVSSNLDEYFMIRVAGLKQQKAAGVRKRDPSGLTPSQQLLLIAGKVRQMVARQTAAMDDVFQRLAGHDFHLVRRTDWAAAQRQFLAKFFTTEVSPVLTPLGVEELSPCPLLPGLQLCVALLVGTSQADQAGLGTLPSRIPPRLGAPPIAKDRDGVPQKLVVIPVPTAFNRFVNIPTDKGTYIAPLEEVILDNARTLFGPRQIRGHAFFRITRDADVAVQDDEAADLLSAVQEAVLSRRRRSAVRLEISAHPDPYIVRWLATALELKAEDLYEIDGLLDARSLLQITEMPPLQGLRVPEWPPQTPRDLLGEEDLWAAIQDHDVLLFHPYEKFDPVLQMVAQAADDPQVLAVKQTLYRATADSPIVQSLARAAENGKEVTALVELRARFDEAKNVNWARRLEDAGCHVIYGIAGFKTHAKALLVVRREAGRIRRYVHLPTGNYNEKTAKQYSDLGLMTCDEELAADVAAFFNLLTGLSEAVEWQQLVIAPTDLRRRFVDLIEREMQVSTPERPGLILAKLNALEDKGMCQALYRASQAGVQIRLNVRGICCLRPGVKGLSETIHVRSIVDRFLEHARLYYFANGGHEEIYLGSADWMKRNLDHRFEILFPIRAPALRQRLLRILDVYFADNVKARELLPEGNYRPVPQEGAPLRAQERLYEDAVAAVQAAEHTAYRFRPLTRTRPDGVSAVS